MDTIDTKPVSISLPTLTCLRCGYEWHPAKEEWPTRCANPKCRSSYWDKPRKYPRPDLKGE